MPTRFRGNSLASRSASESMNLDPGSYSSYSTSKFWATPGFRLFVVWLLLVLGWIQYGRMHFFRDPGSHFYDPSRAYERRYTAVREAEADAYLLAAKESSTTVDHRKDPVEDASICATILTKNRLIPQQYIYKSVGSMLADLTPEERASLRLSVLFADADPEQHSAYNDEWFQSLIDDPFTYRTSTLSKQEQRRMRQLQATGAIEEKSVTDYALAVQRCLDKSKAPYIAVFEDDIILVEGWFSRVLKGLKGIQELMAKEGRADGKGWHYLRLFNQERSTGFESRHLLGNNVPLISLGVSAGVGAALLFLRRRFRMLRYYVLSLGAIGVVTGLAIPSFVMLFFASGKASMLPPSPGVREEPFGCCSQAMVFNRQHAVEFVWYLKQRRVGRYDMITRDFAWHNSLKRISMYPMLAQHIGSSSSSLTSEADAQAVWSMTFEDFDKSSLHSDHYHLIKEIYGQESANKMW